MATISAVSSQPSVESYIQTYLKSDQTPLKSLESSQTDTSKRVSSLSDLKTKLKTLYDTLSSFTDVGTAKKIGAKSAESSDPTIFTAEAESTATIGVNTLLVSQIAKNDTVVSDRLTASDTDIAGYFEGRTIEFSIQVGSEDAVTISIDVDDASETNEEILTRIKDAINNSDASVSANVISDTSTTKRLTIVSDETGSTNEIELKDSGSRKLLKYIGMINGTRKEASGTSGGYITEDTSELNSLFVLNGIQIESDTNEVDDVLTGVTLTLKKAQEADDQAETLVITQDEETVKEQLEGFIKDYNEVIKYLNENVSVDPTSNTRGVFASDYNIRQLRIDLRSMVSGNVSTVQSGNPANLTEIGISIDNNGLLSLSDEDEFNEALEEGATAITDLFDSTQGIAVRLKDKLESFVSTGGIIDDARSASNLKIKTIGTQKSSVQSRLNIRESSLRKQYTQLQKRYSALTSQNTLIQNIMGEYASGYGLNISSDSGLDLTI